jgi:hypothetical protein
MAGTKASHLCLGSDCQIQKLCLVIYPLDYKSKGHIVDDVSF